MDVGTAMATGSAAGTTAGSTRYYLSDNIFTPVSGAGGGLIRVTASKVGEPQVRNTFVIESAEAATPGAGATAAAAGATGGGFGARGGGSTALSKSAALAATAAGSRKKPSDGIVRYGDRVILACNPALTVDPVTSVVGLQYLLR